MPAPAVSVLMPAFNAVGTIADAIDSIVRQSLAEWELIVVDDGSVDGTGLLVDNFVRQDRRVRLIRQAHGGIVSALQAGLEGVQAGLIARMDADDWAYPARLTEQVAALQSAPELGLIGTQVAFAGDRAKASGYALHVDWMNSLISPDEIERNRFIESPFAHPSVMFRRSVVEKLGGYRTGDFPEDYELWLRWLDAGVRMSKVPRVLLDWRDLPGRLSRRDDRYRTEAFYRCKAVYLARWLKRAVSPQRRILVWGAGRLTRRRAELLAYEGTKFSGYVDIDPSKIGRRVAGLEVLAPEDLTSPQDIFVLGYVGKRGARELARAHLSARGFVEGRDFLMAA